MSLLANQYTVEHTGTTSTGTILANGLAFTAAYWRITNDGTLPLRLGFASTVGSTGGYELKAGEDKEFRLPGATDKFSLFTTSSSTEGGDHRRVRVLAMGA